VKTISIASRASSEQLLGDRLAAGQWQGRIRDVTAMKSHKFRAFLKGRRWNGNLYRQFVDDAEQDRSLPDAASWEQLEAYLKQCEADPQALQAARYVWEQYEKDGLETDRSAVVRRAGARRRAPAPASGQA
jgi:hypothetical protein